jgi:nucleoside-diphosphate-sugar epimerase
MDGARVGALPRRGDSLRVLVLGGTGVIGSAVVREIIARGHEVVGLARSEASARKLRQSGATPSSGDIAAPERWVMALPRVDAVIHMACDFASDMATVERRLLDALLPALAAQPHHTRFIYTGGCWLFGATGEQAATEAKVPFIRCRPSPGWCRISSACWPRLTSTAS